MQFKVPMDLFRSALAATKTHTSTSKDDEVGRSIDLSILEQGEVLCTASDGLTIGIARVPIDRDDWLGELGRFSLTPEIASNVISMFAPGKGDMEVWLEISVSFTTEQRPGEENITVATINFRRLGQLFGGDSLRVTTPVQIRKDIDAIWQRISLSARRESMKLPPTKFDLKRLGAFKSAQTTYGEQLAVASAVPSGGSLLVICGAYFIGFIYAEPVDVDNVSSKRYQASKQHWAAELPARMITVS